MSNILISLISEQLYPNLMFIKDNESIDEYVMITTKAMEKQNKTHWLQKAAGIDDSKIRAPIVLDDPFNLPSIIAQLSQEIKPDDSKIYLVNITGGTKPMSLAAYEFFKELSSKIFYVPIFDRMQN